MKLAIPSGKEFIKHSAVIVVIYITIKLIKNRNNKRTIRKKISQKLKEVNREHGRLEQDLAFCNKSSSRSSNNHIVELNISTLLQRLQDGELTSLEVLRAYQAKALEVTNENNCVTEFIREAEEWAKQLDADAKQGKKGPLYGLPFSVKDNVGVFGYDSTIGISNFLNQPATEDAALVIALKSLGAIPFCKTNVPQTNLSFGCSNPIWGLTTNPWDKERTCGGSTGGEACLIGAGGSPIGIGSDIGGSVRLPAAFCGIFSIKPTASRLSLKGFKKLTVGNVGIEPVPGIMARDSETVITITKHLLYDNHLKLHGDPDVLPIPWNEQMFSLKRKLRIGYYEDDGYFPTTPGIRRAVQSAKSKLEALGHELIPFTPPRVEYVVHSFVSILTADQSRYLLGALSNDDVDPLLKPTLFSLRIPKVIKRLLQPLVSFIAPRLLPMYLGVGGNRIRESHQLWSEIMEKNLYKEEFLAYWRKLELDLCIAPCFPCPAPRSKDVAKITPAVSYTSLYNFLDFPVAVMPVDKENLEDQSKLEVEYKHFDLVCNIVKAGTRGAVGMPLAIQIVGLPYQEEMVLQGMNALNAAIQK